MSIAETRECPFCAETIKTSAVVCRFCGRDLPAHGTTAAPASIGPPAPSDGPMGAALLIHQTEVFDLLSGLVQKSLAVYEEDERGHGRYSLLETVRQYSRDRLVEAGGSETARDRHLQLCLRLAEEAEPGLRSFEQKAWAARLESEHDNLRAALEWAMARDPEAALRLGGALWWFWYMRGHVAEGRDWLERALSQSECGTAARAKALSGAGHFAVEQGELAAGRAHLEASLGLNRKRDDLPGCVLALSMLTIPVMVESPAAARSLGEESLALARQLGDPWYLGCALFLLGEAARYAGDLGQAAAYHAEGAASFRRVGDEWLLGVELHNLAWLRQREGDPGQARALFEESLVLFREQRSDMGIAYCLAGLAQSTALPAQPARAARLFAASEGLLGAIGQKMQPVDQAEFDRCVAAARALMDEAAFVAAWAEGRAMTSPEAIEYALQQEDIAS